MVRRFTLTRDSNGNTDDLSLKYKEHLNKQQLQAVTAGDGPLLVLAGAGTGKTRTLVYRLAYLIDRGVAPKQIVLLTFTRRSAHEMLQRAAALLDARCQQVKGGTFHAFCVSILRKHAPSINMPRAFTILDAVDAADVLDMLRTRRGFHTLEERFPRKGTLRSMFSAVVNRQQSLETVVREKYSSFIGHLEPLETLQAAYQTYKQANGLMDYDDLLLRTLELFEKEPEVCQQVAARCRHVLVDEYQDTNRLQAKLVEQFGSVHRNVMVVGDDAQSIYGFRGADYRNILRFPKVFQQTRVVKLEQNYRSTQAILNLANSVVKQTDSAVNKELFTKKKTGDRPALVQAADVSYESRFVAQVVLGLREEGIDLSRLGVLFRRSSDAYELEAELDQRNIPYVKYGGSKLMETAHIKDLMAHLRVAENLHDEVAWNRVLQLLQGIGPKTARDMIEWMHDAAGDPYRLDKTYTSNRYVERLQQLAGVLQTLQETTQLQQQLKTLADYYHSALKRKYPEDWEERQKDIERFVGLAERYDTRQELLSNLAIDPIDFSAVDTEAASEEEDPLVLSTIHSAKGLEFHTVFLIQAVDGVLPSSYALESDEGIDEELRLLYVALTRAQEQLFISYPVLQYRAGLGDYMTKPSRFLEDIPEELLEEWLLVEEDADRSGTGDEELPPAMLSE